VSVPPALERVIRRCLEKSPGERFQSAHDLAFALEALSDASGTSGPVAVAGPRRATMVVVLVALLIAFGLGGALAGRLSARRVPLVPGAASGAAASLPTYKRVTYRTGLSMGARFSDGGRSVVYSGAFEGEPPQVFSSVPGNWEARAAAPPWTNLAALSSRGDMLVWTPASNPPPGNDDWAIARTSFAGGAPKEFMKDVAAVDFGPDGSSLMVVRQVNDKRRLEYPVGKVLLETGGSIGSPRVSPRGDAVAFSHHPLPGAEYGTVEVVGTDGKRRSLGGRGEAITGVAWSPDGREVWFASSWEDKFSLNASTLEGRERVVLRAAHKMELHDIAADGRALFARTDWRHRIRGHVPGRDGEVDLSWYDGSAASDLTPDGRLLLFMESGIGTPRGEFQAFFRPTDGSPAVHLAEAAPRALSPDGTWAVVTPRKTPSMLQLVPTGAGEQRTLAQGPWTSVENVRFFADGKRILINAREKDKGARLWVQDLAGGPPRMISEEGGGEFPAPSPDGALVVARSEGRTRLVPVRGGAPRPVELPAGDVAIGWTTDGRALFVRRFQGPRPRHAAEVYLFDMATRSQKPWRTLSPPDPVGAGWWGPNWILPTPDGRWYVYWYTRFNSDLYVVDGLR
jgi:dipeptidyl aminopeptidase/acylaminoacyl peptidase